MIIQSSIAIILVLSVDSSFWRCDSSKFTHKQLKNYTKAYLWRDDAATRVTKRKAPLVPSKAPGKSQRRFAWAKNCWVPSPGSVRRSSPTRPATRGRLVSPAGLPHLGKEGTSWTSPPRPCQQRIWRRTARRDPGRGSWGSSRCSWGSGSGAWSSCCRRSWPRRRPRRRPPVGPGWAGPRPRTPG